MTCTEALLRTQIRSKTPERAAAQLQVHARGCGFSATPIIEAKFLDLRLAIFRRHHEECVERQLYEECSAVTMLSKQEGRNAAPRKNKLHCALAAGKLRVPVLVQPRKKQPRSAAQVSGRVNSKTHLTGSVP